MTRLPFPGLSDRELALAALMLLVFATAVSVVLLRPRNRLEGRDKAPLPMTSLGARPVLQLELARTEGDVVAILGAGDRQRNVRDARAGNVIDTLLFVPSYGALLLILALLGARGAVVQRPLWFWLIALLVVLVMTADWAENYGIARALSRFEAIGTVSPSDVLGITVPTLVKWVTLGVVSLMLAALWVQFRQGWPRLLSLPLAAVGVWIVWHLVRYAQERYGT